MRCTGLSTNRNTEMSEMLERRGGKAEAAGAQHKSGVRSQVVKAFELYLPPKPLTFLFFLLYICA